VFVSAGPKSNGLNLFFFFLPLGGFTFDWTADWGVGAIELLFTGAVEASKFKPLGTKAGALALRPELGTKAGALALRPEGLSG
jgi:hypothetical protein